MLEKVKKLLQGFFSLKTLLVMILILAVCYGGTIFLLQRAKHHAVEIFNAKMAQQKSMQGSINLGDVEAHVDGFVVFKDFVWETNKGDSVLRVPKGKFKVKPLDVILGRLSAKSVTALEIEDAEVYLSFDEQMKADIIEKNRVIENEDRATVKPKAEKNLILPEKLGNKHLVLRNCTVAFIHKHDIYKLNKVNADLKYVKKQLQIDLKTGAFGGVLIGDSLSIGGSMDTTSGKESLNLKIKLNNVVPASLGVGNIWNDVVMDGTVIGPVLKPDIKGNISFKRLDLPNLSFENLHGQYYYQEGIIHLLNVQGNAFDGSVDAFGEYNLRTREHKIFAHGTNLEASQYFKAVNIKTRLELDLEMINDGTRHGTTYRGHFKSGEGTYESMHFRSLSAFFKVKNKDLYFTNVVLDAKLGLFKAETLNVINKKVKFSGISWSHHSKAEREEIHREHQREREEMHKRHQEERERKKQLKNKNS